MLFNTGQEPRRHSAELHVDKPYGAKDVDL